MTTKEQERQAIEKIRKIVEELGENSYVGFAMEGVLELAEDNIREDTAYSMKKNAEIAWERADKTEKENKDLKKEIEDLKKTVEKRGTTISELNTELCNARAEAKANEIPEELVQEMYCMAYDKEAESIGKMERAADQMAAAIIAGEDVHGFAEEYKKQKANRSRYRKTKQQIQERKKRKCIQDRQLSIWWKAGSERRKRTARTSTSLTFTTVSQEHFREIQKWNTRGRGVRVHGPRWQSLSNILRSCRSRLVAII